MSLSFYDYGPLTRSADGQFLTLAGYNLSVGTPNARSSMSSRVVVRIDASGAVDTTTSSTSLSRQAVYAVPCANAASCWLCATDGMYYHQLGASGPFTLVNSYMRYVSCRIFYGELYCSHTELIRVGNQLPTTPTQQVTVLTTDPPADFFFADLNATIAGAFYNT